MTYLHPNSGISQELVYKQDYFVLDTADRKIIADKIQPVVHYVQNTLPDNPNNGDGVVNPTSGKYSKFVGGQWREYDGFGLMLYGAGALLGRQFIWNGTGLSEPSLNKNASFTGTFLIDATSVNSVSPFKYTHSNIYSNTDPYGSGSFTLDYTGQNNNQPVLWIKSRQNVSNLGNHSLVIQNLGGTGVLPNVVFTKGIELIANNNQTGTSNSAFNGKFKKEIVSGNNSTTSLARNGYSRDMSRSADNTQFEASTEYYPLTVGGHILHKGHVFLIQPTYDNLGASAVIGIETPYNDATVRAKTTLATGNAILELTSGSTSTNGGNYAISAVASSNRLSIQNKSANATILEVLDASQGSTLCVYDATDLTKGSQRYGNSTYNQIVEASNREFNLRTNGKTYLKSNGLYYFINVERVVVSSATGGTTNISSNALRTEILLNHGGAIATYTINLETTPKDGQEVWIKTRNGSVTTLTIASLDGTATIYPVYNTIAQNTVIKFQYRSAGNAWWIA